MNAKELQGYITYNPAMSVGKIDINPYQTIIIQTQNLKLLQTDLGLTIDIPFDVLCKIETIEINGIKFVKEN